MVEGKWMWASNVDNSQWAMLGVQLPNDDGKTMQAGFLLAPRKDWEIEDTVHGGSVRYRLQKPW